MEKIILKEIKGQGHDRQRRLKPAVSETIKEAPLPEGGKLRVRQWASDSNAWSCSRNGTNNGWIANGNNGYADNNNLNNANLAVPLLNYGAQNGH